MASMLAAGGGAVGTRCSPAHNVPPGRIGRASRGGPQNKVIVYGTTMGRQHRRILELTPPTSASKMELVRIVGSALTAKVSRARAARRRRCESGLTADIRWTI